MACAGEAEGRARRGGTVVVETVYDTPYVSLIVKYIERIYGREPGRLEEAGTRRAVEKL